MSGETPHTESGKVLYYLDANGRYESSDYLLRLLDHLDQIGAREQTLLVEEPFPESSEIDVTGLGVRVAADESAHTDDDARRLIDLGYGAIALKPVAKTLTMTVRIAAVAREHDLPCYCADFTVNPILVEWNKMVAARLAAVPGMRLGLLETNGHQNYANWEPMRAYHPHAGAVWTRPSGGVFNLTDDFYELDGGIFETPTHYRELLPPSNSSLW